VRSQAALGNEGRDSCGNVIAFLRQTLYTIQ
jgi:hypothetical protein